MKKVINIPIVNKCNKDHKVLAVSVCYPNQLECNDNLAINVVVVSRSTSDIPDTRPTCVFQTVVSNYNGKLEEVASKVLDIYTRYECTELLIDVSGIGQALADKIAQLNAKNSKNKHGLLRLPWNKKTAAQNDLIEYTQVRPTRLVRDDVMLRLLEAYQSDEIIHVVTDMRHADIDTRKELAWLYGIAYGRIIGYDFT